MPGLTQLSGYRWATGTLTVAALTATYAIESFPDQGDQRGVPWMRPQSRADIILPTAQVQGLDKSLADYGGEVAEWLLPWLSPGMMAYIYNTMLSGSPSAAATIRSFDRQKNTWRVLNSTAHWPAPDVITGLRNVGGGLADFPIKFVGCAAAAAS